MTSTGKTHQPTEHYEEMNPLLRWREFLHILQERRWIAITTFTVVVLAAVTWNLRQPPVYRASARIQFDMPTERILNVPNFSASGTPGYMFGQYIQTQVKALRSRTFIEQVAQSLKASTNPVVKTFVAREPDLANRIYSGLSIAPVEGTLMVDITVEDGDLFAVALLANAVADQFIQADLNRSMETAMTAVEWLRDQAEDQKAKLAASELAVLAYREQTGMVSLDNRQDIVVSKLKALSTSLTEAETTQARSLSQQREVNELSQSGVALADIPAIWEDAQVVEARQKISIAEAQTAALRSRYKDKHPTLLAAVADLEKARSNFTNVCAEARAGIDRACKMAEVNVEGLRRALKVQEQQVLELSRVMVKYDELKRTAEADQELYDSILARMKQTDLAGKLETTNIRLNDRAHSPVTPFKPQKVTVLLQSTAAGIFLGALLVLVVHLMDDRVRRVEDFEVWLGIPVLAMIPRIVAATAAKRAMLSVIEPESQASEAFRGLQASMLMDAAGREAKCIMVVSAGAGEGKSLVASGIASTFAKNGERTLLIDCDLRRPSLHRLFEIAERPGLAALLQGQFSWEDSVCATAQPSLDIMVGVGAPRDPGRILASAALGQLLKEARERYDRVIVDCPPLFGVSDPLLLLTHVDGVVFVARYNRTQRRAIKEACHKLLDGEAPIIGAVINGMAIGSHSYYYQRYGYNHYYNRGANDRKKA